MAALVDASNKEHFTRSNKSSDLNGEIILNESVGLPGVDNGQKQTVSVSQTVHSSVSNSSVKSGRGESGGFPKYQCPTVTLLQKKRDGTIPKGAVYMLGLMSYDEVMNRKNHSGQEFEDVADGQATVIRRPAKSSPQIKQASRKENTVEHHLESKRTKPQVVDATDNVLSPVTSRREMFESSNAAGMQSSSISETTALSKKVTTPRRIEDYEPGQSSVTPTGTDVESRFYNPPISKPGEHSQYKESNIGLDYNIRKLGPMAPTISEAAVHKMYRNIQKGGNIPHRGLQLAVATETNRVPTAVHPDQLQRIRQESVMTPLSIGIPDSNVSPRTRQQRDLENAMRHLRLDRIVAEEKRKRLVEEQRDNLARRHSDFYTPFQRAPVLLNRYDDEVDGYGITSRSGGIRRPVMHPTSGLSRTRGKARALHTFRAQTSRELSFRKGDYLYLLRQVNENWFLGERHGMRGIFPVTYVEVVVSLSDAQDLAAEKEGLARVLFSFDAQSSIELTLKKGDMVKLVRAVDENWYEGRKDGGRRGIFPISYVETLVEPEQSLLTPMTSRTVTPGPLSPCGSVVSYSHSIAPTVPSAPLSPADSDFFDESQFLGSRDSTRNDLLLNSFVGAQSQTPLNDKSSTSASHASPSSFASEVKNLTQSYQWLDKYLDPSNWKSPETAVSAFGGNFGCGPGGNFVGSATWSPQSVAVQPMVGDMRPLSMAKTTSSCSYTQLRYPPYRVQYSYQPRNIDELELRVGDIVYIVEMCDDGWYVGTCERSQEFGTFPGNYVQKMR